jgi:hypothetical protein
MRTFVLCAVASLLIFSLFATAHAQKGPEIILSSSFVDSEGRVNIVGTIRNFAESPVQVTMGVQTSDGRTLQVPTYGRIIWPLTDSPFKFTLEPGTKAGEPFITDVKKIESPYYNMLKLTYDGMAVGEDKAFVGKIKNNAQFAMYNVSVFAAVHSADHKSQLDTVRSNVISVISPGEELEFTAIPDPAIRSGILYYSCAGIDYDDPITTLDTSDGRFISYDLTAVAQISSMRYESGTDSIAFGMRPYSPHGGDVSLKLPQYTQNHTVAIMVDGKLNEAAKVRGDGKTVYINFFVPEGEHEVQIQGVKNMPEFPIAALALAGATTAALATSRFFKAAFKVS